MILGFYDIPAADDYSYSTGVYHAVQSGASLLDILESAAAQVRQSYNTWQGTFSAIFLMALQPAVFGEQYYAVVPALMLTVFTAASIILCHSVFVSCLGLPRFASGTAACLSCFLCVQFLPSPSAAFIWYNSAVHYTFFHSLLLLALALSIRLSERPAFPGFFLLSILCILLGGSNYTCAFIFGILAISGIAFLMILKKTVWKHYLIPLMLFLISFAINIIAPGNRVRQASITELIDFEPNAVHAVISSFKWGFLDSIHWFRLPVIGTLLFSVPIIWNNVPDRSFRFPWLVSLYSYCLLSAMYCPSYYAMDGIAERTVNTVFFSYVFLLFLNLIYWIGWIKHHFNPARSTEAPHLFSLWHCGAASLIFALCCLIYVHTGHQVTVALALHDLRSGDAQGYYETYLGRLSLLHDPAQRDIRFEYSEYYPALLPGLDTVSDPANWVNSAMASYYRKNSIAMIS